MPNTLARPPRRPGESFSISLRRSTAVGIFVSLLVHVVAFLIVMPKIAEQEREIPSPPSRNPLSAQLRPAAPATPPAPEVVPQPPTPPAATPPPPRRPSPQRPQRPAPSRAPVITQRGPSSRSAPSAPPQDKPLPTPFPTPPNDSTPDMASDLRAKQEARKAQEAHDGAPPGGNATANADDLDARIKKNFERRADKNGIFTVRDMGVRTADIYFRGWTDDPRSARGELFHVDAGLSGDIEGAVVAEVIRVIRRDYPEKDFDWESYRLDRIIKLSARKKDTAELAAFLRKELFSAPR